MKEQIIAVQRMQDYIAAHLDEEITSAELARAAVQQSMEKYEPSAIGFKWNADEPRIQLEPIGERGYIELKAVIR